MDKLAQEQLEAMSDRMLCRSYASLRKAGDEELAEIVEVEMSRRGLPHWEKGSELNDAEP